MTNNLSLTIGPETVTQDYPNLTNQQLMAVIRRYVAVKGYAVESMTNTQIGRAALREISKHVRDTSLDRQRVEVNEARRAQDEALLAADNDIWPVPPANRAARGLARPRRRRNAWRG